VLQHHRLGSIPDKEGTYDRRYRSRLDALVEAEDRLLDDIEAFIRQGQMAGRISAESADLMMHQARPNHAANLSMLRKVLADPDV
jgi:hypothetical protein